MTALLVYANIRGECDPEQSVYLAGIAMFAGCSRTSQIPSFLWKNRQEAGSQIQSSLFDLSRHLFLQKKVPRSDNWERMLLTAMFPNGGLLNRLNSTLNQTKPLSIRSSKQFRKRASRGEASYLSFYEVTKSA